MTQDGNVLESLVQAGDEMNLHVCQSYEAEAELRLLVSTQNHIITAQESKPIITITQDALIASYLMTGTTFPLRREQFFDLTMKAETYKGDPLWSQERIDHIRTVMKRFGKWVELPEVPKKPQKKEKTKKNRTREALIREQEQAEIALNIYNGRGLFSLLFPITFIYEKKNNAMPSEPTVKIYEGVFLEGAMDKNILGASHGSIIQILNKEYGKDITANFIDNVQFIGNNWLLIHGFSVGLGDCLITSEKCVLAIKDALTQCYAKAEGIEETTQNPGIREIRITGALSQAKDVGMKIAKNSMRTDNNFLTTVGSGAKGDFFNIAQITGLLGQQNLEGKRVAPKISHGRRTLPHYPFTGMSKEREYESRGFISSSFIHGLSPEEFFFHAMAGREGVCDTATSTAKSGYVQRKIVKVTENIQTQYDGTVRDCFGKIYNFSYGEHGYDAIKTVPVDGEPQFCDVSRLATRLNAIYEDDLDIKEEDEIEATLQEHVVEVRNPVAQQLVQKIREKFPYSLADETWPVEVLRQRLDEIEDNEEDVFDSENEESEDEEGSDEEKKVSDSEDEDLDIEEEDGVEDFAEDMDVGFED